MTPRNFAAYVREGTKTNATTFTDQTLLLYMNMAKDELAKEIATANEDIFGMVYVRNLVRGQREYSLPEYIVNNIKYVEYDEVLYTNPDSLVQQLEEFDRTCSPNSQRIPFSGRYIHAEELDINTFHGATDELSIRKEMWGRKPQFDIFRNSLWLYTAYEIPPINDGIKLHAIRYPDNFTTLNSDTDMANDMVRPISAGIPRQFHKIWADMVIVMYKTSKEKPIPLTQNEQLIEARKQKALDNLKEMNLDRITVSTVPTYDNGSNY